MAQLKTNAKRYGALQAASKAILPKLALDVARAAHAGEIDEDSIKEIYGSYIKVAGDGSQPPTSKKVQESKLRQIAIAAMSHRGYEQIKDTVEVHRKLKDEGEPVKPEFPAMVDVARAIIGQPRALTRTQIRELCLK